MLFLTILTRLCHKTTGAQVSLSVVIIDYPSSTYIVTFSHLYPVFGENQKRGPKVCDFGDQHKIIDHAQLIGGRSFKLSSILVVATNYTHSRFEVSSSNRVKDMHDQFFVEKIL